MGLPDYTFAVEEPPPPAKKGPPPGHASVSSVTPLADNLTAVAELRGGSGRIVTYDSYQVARTIASQLRQGKKLPNRPPGKWVFTTGPTKDGRFGIWAQCKPET